MLFPPKLVLRTSIFFTDRNQGVDSSSPSYIVKLVALATLIGIHNEIMDAQLAVIQLSRAMLALSFISVVVSRQSFELAGMFAFSIVRS